jgi:hypothetical protein
MEVYFSISELCITGDTVPLPVADKLLKYHIIPMNAVREALGVPVHCRTSEGLCSGYRPFAWEIENGRSGRSQHTFGEGEDGSFDVHAKGAIDWRCQDFSANKDTLLDLIIEHTNYTRIAVYESFIHCDYKPTVGGKRQLFTSTASSKWTFVKHV